VESKIAELVEMQSGVVATRYWREREKRKMAKCRWGGKGQ
jgi:hypothetical protein